MNSDDFARIRAAVQLRERCVEAAQRHHQRAGLVPRHDYARATFDATEAIIRADHEAALQAAGRLLPEPTETRVEWGVWWHAGNPDGICLDECHLRGEKRAHEVGAARIGEYGITSYTIIRREHHRYETGWFVPHWTRHSGPHTPEEQCASA